jgi:hypothetical protein
MEMAYSGSTANQATGETTATTTATSPSVLLAPSTTIAGTTSKDAERSPVPPVTVTQTVIVVPAAGATNNSITVAGNQYSTNNNSKLMNILIYNAITQPEKIQQLLSSDKVPESAKPALRRALAASNIGYQNAISNLNSPKP